MISTELDPDHTLPGTEGHIEGVKIKSSPGLRMQYSAAVCIGVLWEPEKMTGQPFDTLCDSCQWQGSEVAVPFIERS